MTIWRSTLLIALLPLVLAVAGVLAVQSQLRARLADDARAQLTSELLNIEALYDQRRVIAVRQAMEFRSLRQAHDTGLYLLQQRDGTRLAGNLEDWPQQVGKSTEGFATTTYQTVVLQGPDGVQRPYLVAGRTLRGGFPMLVGRSLAPMEQTLAGMKRVFVLLGGIMLIAGVSAAALVTFTTRRRLTVLNRFLERVGSNAGVAERLPDGGPSEFDQLSGHVNEMLERIAHLLAAHQRLGNAVAHEMRTPLGRIKTRLAALDLPADQAEAMDAEIRAMIRLFDSLLSIAEMDAKAGNTAGLEPVNLSAICTSIAELYEPVAEEAGRTLITRIAPDLHILGDSGLLTQLLSNLIENGLKYTRPGDTITLSLSASGSRLDLRVSDTGPGIDTGLKDRIFAPFTRGPRTEMAPGHGLGLALVRAIALRHGAKLSLPDVDKGFALNLNCLQFKGKSDSQSATGG